MDPSPTKLTQFNHLKRLQLKGDAIIVVWTVELQISMHSRIFGYGKFPISEDKVKYELPLVV